MIAHKFLNTEELSEKSTATEIESEKSKRSQGKSQTNNVPSQLKQNMIQLRLDESVERNYEPENLPLIERLKILQKSRDVGLYVKCDNCGKYRYLKDTKDPLDLPLQWFCYMNPGE